MAKSPAASTVPATASKSPAAAAAAAAVTAAKSPTASAAAAAAAAGAGGSDTARASGGASGGAGGSSATVPRTGSSRTLLTVAPPTTFRAIPTVGRHLVVAGDSSDAAHGAFEAACAFAKRGDRLTVVHVANMAREYAPYEMKPSQVEDWYATRCVSRFPSGLWKVVLKPLPAGQTERQALLTFLGAKDTLADVFFVGFKARRGPKEDHTVLGSSADASLREAHMSSYISKDKSYPDKALMVVCVDGSDRAHSAVQLTLSLARSGDSVHILHIAEGSGAGSSKFDDSAVDARYTDFCALHKHASYHTVARTAYPSVADAIVAYTNDTEASVVVVGADGLNAHAHGRAVLGSNSDAVVRKASCNVLVVQETHSTLAPASPASKA